MTSWYRTAEMPPPLNVRVVVLWDDREFEAARIQRDDAIVWVTHQRGEPIFLPTKNRRPEDPDRPWAGWHTLSRKGPQYWRPINAARWALPLPEAVVFPKVAEGVMRSERLRFAAVSDAEAADLAREMEADRAQARDSRETIEVEGREVAWWLDSSRIDYEPAGEVTTRNCEGRLMRALAWCGASDFRERTAVNAEVLAEIADAVAEIDIAPDPFASFKPLPTDRRDFETAMAWFTALSPPEHWRPGREPWSLSQLQKVLVVRARPMPPSYDTMAEVFSYVRKKKISGEWLRQQFKKGVERCCRAANGHEVYPGISDQIAALRERNRSYKRGS